MKYDISKSTPPAMPNLGRGTEFIALLHSQVSKDMQQSITPMFFPALGAHISGAEFILPTARRRGAGQVRLIIEHLGDP